MAAKTYMIYNSSAPTTAAPVKQPTGTAIRTMLQLNPTVPIRIIEWGMSFDASALAAPGACELFTTTVAATMSSTFVAGDVFPHNDPNAPANTAGTTGVPLGLGTANSGFATAAVTEGTVANYRGLDYQLWDPVNPYYKQFPQGREPEIAAGQFIRVRVTFGTTVNMAIYINFEV